MTNKFSLILGGGGAWGSHCFGACSFFEEQDVKYDGVTGTSIGAVLGAFVVSKKVNLFIKKLLAIKDISSFLLKTHAFPYFDIYNKFSAYSSDNIRKLLLEVITKNDFVNGPELIVSYVDYQSGQLEHGSSKKLSFEKMIDAIMASCALPGAFPPVYIDGKAKIDGGFRESLPVESAVNNFKDSKHFLILSPNGVDTEGVNYSPSFTDLPNSVIRYLDILIAEVNKGDIQSGVNKYWVDKTKFSLIQPEKIIPKNVIDFDKVRMIQNLDLGKKQAEEWYDL